MHGVKDYNKSEAKHIVAEAKVNHDTQFYRIKTGVTPPPPPPPPPQSPMTLTKFYESCSQRDREQDS